jgi:hypothetical protein
LPLQKRQEVQELLHEKASGMKGMNNRPSISGGQEGTRQVRWSYLFGGEKMACSSWFPGILAFACLGQANSSSPPLPDTFQLKWQLKHGDEFYQELVTQQKSVFRVKGLLLQSGLQYRILSSFSVVKMNGDGSLDVKQKIEEANLLQADSLTQPLVLPQLKKMPGTVFSIHFNKDMEVTEFLAPPIQAAIGRNDLGLQMVSLLDRDGWKEMAEVSFFQPNRPLKAGSQWDRSMSHGWGEFGKWAGKVHYRYEGKQKSLHKVGYVLKMTYEAPKEGGQNLIGKAAFQTQTAHGNIYFDADQGKVLSAEELFHVRGVLEINLLGQKTPVEMEEQQTFKLRIFSQK